MTRKTLKQQCTTTMSVGEPKPVYIDIIMLMLNVDIQLEGTRTAITSAKAWQLPVFALCTLLTRLHHMESL